MLTSEQLKAAGINATRKSDRVIEDFQMGGDNHERLEAK